MPTDDLLKGLAKSFLEKTYYTDGIDRLVFAPKYCGY
jgi:hypothetical protein